MLVLVLCCSAVATWLLLRLGSNFANIDIPNHRSLHKQPIPSAGGLAIVLSGCAGGMLFVGTGLTLLPLNLLLVAGLALALAGYIDDRHKLTASARLVTQIVVAAIVIWAGLNLSIFSFGDLILEFPWWLATFFTSLFIIWIINLYNFMDDMDDLAATMAIVGFNTLR